MHGKMSGHVFVSYSRQDQKYTRKLVDDLRQRGFEVWIDDRVDFGDQWWRTIVQAIRSCRSLVVVMTPDSEESEWVEREVQLALREGKPIFPVLLRGREFPLLITTQFADVTGGRMPPQDFYDRLTQLLPVQQGQQRGEKMISNPFTYGNPIRDPNHFYGRRWEVQQTVGRLLSSAFESTSIVGERRMGKTSLLNYISHPQAAPTLGLSQDKYVMVVIDLQGLADITPTRFWQRVLGKMERRLDDFELIKYVGQVGAQEEIELFDLEDLFHLVEDKGLKVVLLFDEFEYITQNPNFDTNFFAGLRALAIHYPLALITSTRRELVDLCHSNEIKGSPFFNIFGSVVLKPMPTEEVDELLDGALADTPFPLAAEERDYVHRLAGRQPMFVQMAGYYVYEAHQRGYEADDLYGFVEENFAQQADPHLTYQWTHSTESEKITLLSLLALDRARKEKEAHPDIKRIAELHARAKHNLRDLTARGLAVEDEGRYALCSPIFGDWISEEIMTAAGEEEEDQTSEEWLRQHEEIEKGLGDKVISVLPRFNKKYWPVMGAFVKELSIKLAADEVINLTTLLLSR